MALSPPRNLLSSPWFRLLRPCSCLVQVSYSIAVAEPLSVFVDTYGTGTMPDAEILKLIRKHFDFRPGENCCCEGLPRLMRFCCGFKALMLTRSDGNLWDTCMQSKAQIALCSLP